ncbi:MAG TPA: glycosyltransferase family A protein [Sinomonas sp.]|nr:glycosyltransferase family A protein [Sinomonas sp.]
MNRIPDGTAAAHDRSVDVSIIMPCYNRGDTLLEAVESAVTQRGVAVEVLIVDDGSGRRTRAVIDSISHERVRVLRQANAGPSAARNAGIRNARGRYILPLDADDTLSPGVAKLGADVLDAQPKVGIVAGATRIMGNPEVIPCAFDGIETMLPRNTILNTAMFRRADWEAVGGYPESLRMGEDWAFWMRVLSLGREVVVRPEVFFDYRRSSPQQATHSPNPLRVADAQNLVLREHAELYRENFHLVVEQLITTRAALAGYRRAYRPIDRAKAAIKTLLRLS